MLTRLSNTDLSKWNVKIEKKITSMFWRCLQKRCKLVYFNFNETRGKNQVSATWKCRRKCLIQGKVEFNDTGVTFIPKVLLCLLGVSCHQCEIKERQEISNCVTRYINVQLSESNESCIIYQKKCHKSTPYSPKALQEFLSSWLKHSMASFMTLECHSIWKVNHNFENVSSISLYQTKQKYLSTMKWTTS